MTRPQLMQKIMEYSFALVDLTEYLDTHPDDRDALETFGKLKDIYKKYYDEYTTQYGPLTSCDVNSTSYWTWVADCFPWEGGI